MRGVEEGVVVAADEEDRDPEVVAVEEEVEAEVEAVVEEAEAVVEAVGEVDAWIKMLYNANWKSC